MVNKLVTFAAKKAGGKTFEKTIEKASDTYDYIKDRIRWGIKPLNIGEDESLECYRKYPNDKTRCKALGDKIRDNYHHPWRTKK